MDTDEQHDTEQRPSTNKKRPCDLMEFCRPPWEEHFQDILHCRFRNCTQRVQAASNDQIQSLKKVSLLSTAINSSFNNTTGASSSGDNSKQVQEQELVDYTKALLARGVDPNDTYLPRFFQGPENRSAVGTAAYYGYIHLLEFLLVQAKCSIATGHPLEYAVSNRQHESMKVLFDHCSTELCELLHQESSQGSSRDYQITTLGVAINNTDVVAIRMLHERGHAMLRTMGHYTKVKFLQALQELYPSQNQCLRTGRWTKELHWTFPITDRQMINWIWHVLRPSYSLGGSGGDSSRPCVCDDVWLKILSFVGREWWYDTMHLP